MAQRCVYENLGSPHVGLETFARVHLKEREVLERSGMEHHLWTVFFEDLIYAVTISNVTNHQVAIVEQCTTFDG